MPADWGYAYFDGYPLNLFFCPQIRPYKLKSYVDVKADKGIPLMTVAFLFGNHRHMKNFISSLLIAAIPFSQSACASVKEKKAIDPVVAVIDTGFDISHPALRNSIVDSYDFSRGTTDVIPYIIRKNLSGDIYSRLQSLIKLAPELQTWFQPERDIEGEFRAAAFHGTAVASLALYDLKVGVALYKIYPIPENVDSDEWMANAVSAAIKRAIARNARVINLSLGFTFELGSVDTAKHQKLMRIIQDVIIDNSGVLFIAASGNENQTIDNVRIAGYPCGLPLENVICVGAITHEGQPWKVSVTKGTNLVEVAGTTTVFSYGDYVFSAVPLKMCVTKETMKTVFSRDTVTKDLAEKLLKTCNNASGFINGEASSIATPLVTHRALEILTLEPAISVGELKIKILRSTLTSKMNSEIKYVDPLKPSWASKW